MMQRRHRIEEMGEHRGAGLKPGDRRCIGRVAVAQRNSYAARTETSDGFERAVELGSQRDKSQAFEPQHSFQSFPARNEIVGRMGAKALR